MTGFLVRISRTLFPMPSTTSAKPLSLTEICALRTYAEKSLLIVDDSNNDPDRSDIRNQLQELLIELEFMESSKRLRPCV